MGTHSAGGISQRNISSIRMPGLTGKLLRTSVRYFRARHAVPLQLVDYVIKTHLPRTEGPVPSASNLEVRDQIVGALEPSPCPVFPFIGFQSGDHKPKVRDQIRS